MKYINKYMHPLSQSPRGYCTPPLSPRWGDDMTPLLPPLGESIIIIYIDVRLLAYSSLLVTGMP